MGDYVNGTAGGPVMAGPVAVPLAGSQTTVDAEFLTGVRYDEQAGTTTVYVTTSGSAESGGTGIAPGELETGGEPKVVATTYDAQGNVVPNPPSSLVAPPPGGETETVVGFSGSTPLPGGFGGGAGMTHERTEYPDQPA